MKIKIIVSVTLLVFCIGVSTAQNQQYFEGESTARVYKNIKTKHTQTGGDFLTKMIIKAVMKRYISNNPDINYSGSYTAVTITKGGKTRVEASYNNSVTIDIPVEDGQLKEFVYYPYIKKGYYFYRDVTLVEDKDKMEQMRKGEIKKTGQVEILGKKCDVYKVMYNGKTDSLGTITDINLHNEYAICTDPRMPGADTEVLPGVKGCPLKFTTNNVSQSSNASAGFNMDIMYSISQITTSLKPRPVDDSEFEVPSDIKMYEIGKSMKVIYENMEYMKKKGLWQQLAEDDNKIYDNIADDWDF